MRKRSIYQAFFCLLILLALCLTACQTQTEVPEPEQIAEETKTPAEEVSEPEPEPEPEPAPEPEYLIHTAYMRGNDYFFYPDKHLSRAEAAQLLAKLFEAEAVDVAFSDVPADAWFFDSVTKMAAFLPGYEDGTYKPNTEITLDEFTAALLQLKGLPASTIMKQTAILRWAGEAALPEDPITRANVTVILNRVLKRMPDKAWLDKLENPCFLDVAPEHEAYYDILEACLTHEYLQEEGEIWKDDQFAPQTVMMEGVHRSANAAWVVGADGCIVTEPGLLYTETATYLILENGQAALAGLHLLDEGVVYVTEDCSLLKGGAWGEYQFDADGWYTSGDADLDTYVAEVLEACTTADMTREEKLRACYEYVRAFKYLGRNSALPGSCKTFPMDKAVAYANKIFSTGKGDCYNFTAAFCFLARALGYEASSIAGVCGYVWNSTAAITHGWVEIVEDGQIYLFDPQIENYNNRSGISNETNGAYRVTYATARANYYKN